MVDVARPARAMATSGSPPTALAYQRLEKPSASAFRACSIMRSGERPPPDSPILMGAPYPGADPPAPAAPTRSDRLRRVLGRVRHLEEAPDGTADVHVVLD